LICHLLVSGAKLQWLYRRAVSAGLCLGYALASCHGHWVDLGKAPVILLPNSFYIVWGRAGNTIGKVYWYQGKAEPRAMHTNRNDRSRFGKVKEYQGNTSALALFPFSPLATFNCKVRILTAALLVCLAGRKKGTEGSPNGPAKAHHGPASSWAAIPVLR